HPEPFPARPARSSPRPRPRGEGHAARRGATPAGRPRAGAPRSARAGRARGGPPPCSDGSRGLVTRLCRKRDLDARGPGREVPGRTRPQPEERVVERRNEPGAVLVEQGLEDRPAYVVGCLDAAVPTSREPQQAVDEGGALAAALADEDRRAHRRRPEPVRAAEERRERLAQPLGTDGLVLEKRQLPALDRLRELRFAFAGEPLEQVAAERCAPGVQPSGLALRQGRRRPRQWAR